ncbi:MAG TPA: hypothetical protein VFW05_04200 [Verrucomicrobiae bacterium]|nr:hypothetical protein [Verrucomicrobiae bacterium]
MKALSSKGVRQEEPFTPPLVVPVLVRCGDRRCLAYRDATGAWVDYESGELLVEQVQVIQPAFL